MAEVPGFALGAAFLRRADGDMRAFMGGLAEKLEGDLPHAVAVERRRDGLFSRTSHVASIAVTAGNDVLTLHFDGRHATADVRKVVRGITIATKPITVPEWLDRLVAHVARAGEGADEAGRRLHEFLVS